MLEYDSWMGLFRSSRRCGQKIKQPSKIDIFQVKMLSVYLNRSEAHLPKYVGRKGKLLLEGDNKTRQWLEL